MTAARLTVKETTEYLRLSRSRLDELRANGGGPPFIQLGKRVFYDKADLDAWLDEHRAERRPDAAQ